MTTEMRMKEWRLSEAARRNVAPSTVAGDLARGHYPEVRIRRVNARVVFVRAQNGRSSGKVR